MDNVKNPWQNYELRISNPNTRASDKNYYDKAANVSKSRGERIIPTEHKTFSKKINAKVKMTNAQNMSNCLL